MQKDDEHARLGPWHCKLWDSVSSGPWSLFLLFAPILGNVDTETFSPSHLSSAMEEKLQGGGTTADEGPWLL